MANNLLMPLVYPYRDSWDSLPIYSADEVLQRAKWLCQHHLSYSQEGRCWTMNDRVFDCSSFVATVTGYSQAFPGWPPATTNMPEEYKKYGYQYVYKDPRTVVDPSLFKKGDVLIYTKPGTTGLFNDGHTAVYIGDGLITDMGGSGGSYGKLVGNRWQEVLRNPKSGFYPVKWEGN